MTKQECKKIEFYLYNYNRINILIKEREMQIIDSINVSSRNWIKSLKGIGNTTEDQVKNMREISYTYDINNNKYEGTGKLWWKLFN